MFKSLESHSQLLGTLLALHREQRQRLNTLEDILLNLRAGYNPNYQDMAVLEAVRGWEQVAGLLHINDVKKNEGEGEKEPPPSEAQEEASGEDTERLVEDLLKTNYVSLLMEHDQYADESQAIPNGSPCPLPLSPFPELSLRAEPRFIYPPLFRSSFRPHPFVCLGHLWSEPFLH